MLLTAEQLQAKDNAPGSIHIKGNDNRDRIVQDTLAFARFQAASGNPGTAHVCAGCLIDIAQGMIVQILIDANADAQASAQILAALADGFVDMAESTLDPTAALLKMMGVDPADVKVIHTGSDAPANQIPAKPMTDPSSIQASILSFFSKK